MRVSSTRWTFVLLAALGTFQLTGCKLGGSPSSGSSWLSWGKRSPDTTTLTGVDSKSPIRPSSTESPSIASHTPVQSSGSGNSFGNNSVGNYPATNSQTNSFASTTPNFGSTTPAQSGSQAGFYSTELPGAAQPSSATNLSSRPANSFAPNTGYRTANASNASTFGSPNAQFGAPPANNFSSGGNAFSNPNSPAPSNNFGGNSFSPPASPGPAASYNASGFNSPAPNPTTTFPRAASPSGLGTAPVSGQQSFAPPSTPPAYPPAGNGFQNFQSSSTTLGAGSFKSAPATQLGGNLPAQASTANSFTPNTPAPNFGPATNASSVGQPGAYRPGSTGLNATVLSQLPTGSEPAIQKAGFAGSPPVNSFSPSSSAPTNMPVNIGPPSGTPSTANSSFATPNPTYMK